MDTTKTKQLAAIIQAITEQPEPRNKEITRELAEKYRIIAAADRASGEQRYTETEVDRALRGFTRMIITAAVDNIQNTDDLTAFLGELSGVRCTHFQTWIENEQTDIARGLF
jgi:hypothetical protein